MPTGRETLEDKRFVESQGYSVALLNTPSAKGTWYRPDGLAIPNQPVDGYARARNRAKGWTLRPPEGPIHTPQAVAVGAAPAGTTTLERAVSLGVKLEDPPKHMHVMREDLGSPCLVLGCTSVRKLPKGTFKDRRKAKKSRRIKEGAHAI